MRDSWKLILKSNMRWFLVWLMIINLCFWSLPVLAEDNYDQSAIPELKNPLQDATGMTEATTAKGQVTTLIGSVIYSVVGIVGSISLVMFIYAGIRFMTARGNAEEAKKAMQIMVWTALGLLVIFSSYLILRFVFDIFLTV